VYRCSASIGNFGMRSLAAASHTPHFNWLGRVLAGQSIRRPARRGHQPEPSPRAVAGEAKKMPNRGLNRFTRSRYIDELYSIAPGIIEGSPP
jgi:hypothetical protein